MTENAVELGLKWLADHQDASDGGWEHDLTATGLSVLSFLGAGYTDRGTKRDNPHASTVRQGLRFLAGKQNEQGRFRAEELVAGHAIATLALAEAWAMTRNPRYKKVAQQGLNFLAHARNPYLAWGKKPRDGTNDTETTLWCLLALRAGKFGGLDVDPDAFEGARTWLAESKAAFTIDEAASVLVGRILLGEDPRKSLELKALTARCLKYAPTDLKEAGYLHLATLGLFQVGGARWKAWNRAVIGWMTKQQRPGGSWDRPGADAHERVRTTALLTMCLEVYYRYDRVFGLR